MAADGTQFSWNVRFLDKVLQWSGGSPQRLKPGVGNNLHA